MRQKQVRRSYLVVYQPHQCLPCLLDLTLLSLPTATTLIIVPLTWTAVAIYKLVAIPPYSNQVCFLWQGYPS